MEKQVCKIVYDKKENSSLRKQELFFIQLGSTISELKESIQFNEEHISDLKLENKKLQQDVCELQKQLLYMEGKCKICGTTRRASWQHEWWWRRSQWRVSTNRRYKRDCIEISRTAIKDSKCARKNWIPETSPLRKTEKWKLASDYCTIFTLWE